MGITVNEAGRRGGLRTLQKHGRDFFVRIGQRGQAAVRARYPGRAREWGKLGGRPRKPNLENMGSGQRN